MTFNGYIDRIDSMRCELANANDVENHHYAAHLLNEISKDLLEMINDQGRRIRNF